jgi:hypothetical protein
VSRIENTQTTTTVRHTAKPYGRARENGPRARENGPHLGDLRAFVAECEGLPDDVRVRFTDGYMGESGRYDVTIEASWKRSADESAG